jgi:hypothetical protein
VSLGEIAEEAKTLGDDLEHVGSKLDRRENVIGWKNRWN